MAEPRKVKCPNCQTEQPETNRECPNCQLNWIRWRESQARKEAQGVVSPPVHQTVPPQVKRRRILIGAVLGGLIGIVAVLFFLPIRGLPVPEGAQRLDDLGLAIIPIPEWHVSQARIDRKLIREVLSMVRPAEDAWTSPVLTVSVAKMSVPAVSERRAAQIMGIFLAELRADWDTFRTDTPSVVTIDGLKAVRFMARAGKTIVVIPAVTKTMAAGTVTVTVSPAVTKEYAHRALVLIVPASEGAYLLVGRATESDFAALSPAFEAAVASFRITRRPRRWDEFSRGVLRLVGK